MASGHGGVSVAISSRGFPSSSTRTKALAGKKAISLPAADVLDAEAESDPERTVFAQGVTDVESAGAVVDKVESGGAGDDVQ